MGETTLLDELSKILFKIKTDIEEKRRLQATLTNEIDCMIPLLWKLESVVDEEKKKEN